MPKPKFDPKKTTSEIPMKAAQIIQSIGQPIEIKLNTSSSDNQNGQMISICSNLQNDNSSKSIPITVIPSTSMRGATQVRISQ
jgi:hypothetical protein